VLPVLPVLDISGYLADPHGADGRRFVDELRDACHDVGFAHLVGHGIDPALERQVHERSAEFFALSEPDRLEIANTNSPHFRGYTRLGMEHTGGRPDWRDQIDIGPERPASPIGTDSPQWLRLRGPNQWPTAVPELQPVVTEWMDAMAVVGRAVLRALAEGLGQPIDFFEPMVGDDPEVLVKIIRYPALPDGTASDQGVGAHHDAGWLTFILQDMLHDDPEQGVGGLQVQLGGAFVDVTPLTGAYVLNLGEMLQLATGGYLRATRHRVVSPPPGRQRVSVVYFFNPMMESQCLPIDLPPELASAAVASVGGQNVDPNDPVFSIYGENWLKFRLRSHPDVAAIHHADLVAALGEAPTAPTGDA
jgi:isopenicillin N synthase-like dioxygenase